MAITTHELHELPRPAAELDQRTAPCHVAVLGVFLPVPAAVALVRHEKGHFPGTGANGGPGRVPCYFPAGIMGSADRRKVVVAVAGSLLVTTGLVALVLSLGSWAYQTRRFLLHERRLALLLEQHPTASDVSTALLAEPGSRLIAAPTTDDELEALTRDWSRAHVDEIVAKRRTAREVRIFGVQDMVYVLFFDADGRLQSYVLMSG